jgi:diamine N-acetyltransferase
MISIRKADKTDIPAIQQLAIPTWTVTYKDILPEAQLAYMLQQFFHEAALKQQLDDGYQYIVAFNELAPIGFASYSNTNNNSTYKLNRLYILPDQQGKGTGKLLLGYVINDIKSKNATHLQLNVNRYNKALHFYQKHGFEIIKEEDIDIGNGFFMNDYVMMRDITFL